MGQRAIVTRRRRECEISACALSGLVFLGREDHRRHLFLGRVDVAQDDIEERHHDRRDRDGEQHRPAAEEDPDRVTETSTRSGESPTASPSTFGMTR